MAVQKGRDLTRLIAIVGVWWSAVTLLVSTNTAQRVLAPVWNAVGIGAADIALMPLGVFLGVRFVTYLVESAKRPEPPPVMGFLITLVAIAMLAGVVYLYQADYYGSWIVPVDYPLGLLIGSLVGGIAALLIFLLRNP